MFSSRVTTTILASILLMFGGNLMAGDRPIELGIDAGLSVVIIDDLDESISNFDIPIQAFRVGFFATARCSVEPRFALASTEEGDYRFTTINFGIAGHFHSSADRDQARFYFGPSIGLSHFRVSSIAESQMSVGGDIGMKAPVLDRLATRFEVSVDRWFETDRFRGLTQVTLSVGLSFFTK